MEINIYNINGKLSNRKILLNNSIFEVKPNNHLVYLEVKRYLASQRKGTHKTKARSEVTGSTRKLQRQKGTGSSRKGDIKNPIFRGGGRVFGPKPRDYYQKLNKNSRKIAKQIVLNQKLSENAFLVIEDFFLEKPKTKSLVNILRIFNIEKNKILFLLSNYNKNIFLASKNLQGKKVIIFNELNIYDLLNASKLIFFESAFLKIKDKYLIKDEKNEANIN